MINQLVKYSLDNNLIYETLIDKIFDTIESRKDYSKIDSPEDLIVSVYKILNIYGIELQTIEKDNIFQPSAACGLGKNGNPIIIVYLPKSEFNNDIASKVFSSVLHELGHILVFNKIPNIINIKRNGKLINIKNIYDVITADYNILFPNNSECIKFLDYVFHIREIPNFAFTTAYSCRNDFLGKTTVKQFYDINKNYIINNTIDYDSMRNWIKQICLKDSFILFQIQFAVNYLNQSEYNNKIHKFLRLCMKYEKRLNKILGVY